MSLTVNEKLAPVARVFDAMDKSYPPGSELALEGKGHTPRDELLGRTTVCPLAGEEALSAEVMRERRLIENLREGE